MEEATAYEQWLERRVEARMRRDEARFALKDFRLRLRQREAEALVGQLCREGKTVYYITLLPRRGKYKESASRHELVEYLLRNNYV